ncbi:MAG: MgtE protein [Proteobacteria bacterium]|nr:MgtE protein [Pseudomonadota bacterium]MBU1737332.1 MgtE protein [Pseudomonadota bacterium]
MKFFPGKYKSVALFVLMGCFILLTPFHVSAVTPKTPVKATEAEMERAGRLEKMEKELALREKTIAVREKELETISKEVDRKLAELIDLQQKVQARLDELQAVKDKRFKALIKTYSEMSATKLAPLLNKMDDTTVAEILRAMKPEEVAKILPKIDQRKAVNVSKILGMLGGVEKSRTP